MNNPCSSHTLLQVAQGNTESKTCKRVCLPYPEKIVFKKFLTLQKIKHMQRTGDTNSPFYNLTKTL